MQTTFTTRSNKISGERCVSRVQNKAHATAQKAIQRCQSLQRSRLTHYVRETINVGSEMTFAKTIERHLIVLIVKRFCHVHGPYRVQDDETDFRFFAKAAEMIFAHLVASQEAP